jgi:hypothetical protein
MEPAKGTKPGGDFQLAPEEAPPPGATLKPCGDCGRLIPGDSKKCIHCGHGGGTPPPPAADAPPLPCVFCQYDLRGSPAGKCPECGKQQPRTSRRARDELMARDVARHDIKRCLIYVAAGVVLIGGLAVWGDGVEGLVSSLAQFGVSIVVSIFVYAICGVIWLGLDGGFGLLSLRVAASVSAAYVSLILVGFATYLFACLGFVGIVLPFLVYASMLWELCEIDLQDAVIVSVVTMGATVGAWLAIVAMLS